MTALRSPSRPYTARRDGELKCKVYQSARYWAVDNPRIGYPLIFYTRSGAFRYVMTANRNPISKAVPT